MELLLCIALDQRLSKMQVYLHFCQVKLLSIFLIIGTNYFYENWMQLKSIVQKTIATYKATKVKLC